MKNTLLILCFALLSATALAKPDNRALLSGTTYNGQEGAVATVSALATEAAVKQLQTGGNAIDAAIAAALTLGVVDSYNSGIGGGLFALIRWQDGQVEAIDGREMAPSLAHRDLYIREGRAVAGLSRTGSLAIGIPGSVAVLDYLATKGAKREIATHYRQAAKIAREGFAINLDYVNRLTRSADSLALFPASSAIFLNKEQQALPLGYRLQQPDLANTYEAIAKQGPDYFYRGGFAKALTTWMEENGGLITAEDMASYRYKIRQPVETSFYDYQVYGFPPPSSGGVHVAQILSTLEALNWHQQPAAIRQHLLVEAMKLAFADRAYWLGDPDFVNVPKGLIDPVYINQQATKINPDGVLSVTGHSEPPNVNEDWFDKHTTHIAVADKQGNWVAITTTLNTSFGSKVVIPGTGVLMNNQMDDFSAQPGVPNAYGLVGSEANAIQGGKRPLSSMSPTIVVKDGKPIMTVGAAGGPMIITQVVQAIARHLLLEQDLYQSLAAPRVHHQWLPPRVYHDKKLSEQERETLRQLGHELKQLRFEGSSNAISLKSGQFDAVSEPRLVERNARR